MPSHEFNYPKVTTVKATSAHRKTKVHPVVPPSSDEASKDARPRRKAPNESSPHRS